MTPIIAIQPEGPTSCSTPRRTFCSCFRGRLLSGYGLLPRGDRIPHCTMPRPVLNQIDHRILTSNYIHDAHLQFLFQRNLPRVSSFESSHLYLAKRSCDKHCATNAAYETFDPRRPIKLQLFPVVQKKWILAARAWLDVFEIDKIVTSALRHPFPTLFSQHLPDVTPNWRAPHAVGGSDWL